LLPAQEDLILSSRVVHTTIDPSIPLIDPSSVAFKGGKDDEDEEPDPDRVITKARPATPADGLLTIPEIVTWFQKLPRLRSAYSEGLRHAKEVGIDVETYGKRELLPDGRHGCNEPEYTSYTFYWKSVLGMFPSLQCLCKFMTNSIQIISFFWMQTNRAL
jgi:RNA exonuclease NGL2